MGTSCYLLNNDALQRSIRPADTFDVAFPPFARLLVFFGILIVFTYILYRLHVIRLLVWPFRAGVFELLGGGWKIIEFLIKYLHTMFKKLFNIIKGWIGTRQGSSAVGPSHTKKT